MALFIVIVIIALVALTLYDHLSPSLPKQWRLSKDGGTSAAQVQPSTPSYGPQLPQVSSDRWSVVVDGVNTRAVREFATPIHAAAQLYDPPLMYFSCYQG